LRKIQEVGGREGRITGSFEVKIIPFFISPIWLKTVLYRYSEPKTSREKTEVRILLVEAGINDCVL
jgi:hypothetical protein